MAPIGPTDHSHFSPPAPAPASSTIVVVTPPVAVSHRNPDPNANNLSYAGPDMLQLLAKFLPPPPVLSVPPLRHPAPAGPSSPRILTSHRTRAEAQDELPSPTDRSRRAPPSDHLPVMNITTSPEKHTLDVQLPTTIQPEMITISANKGDKLKVVADAWHMENDCHYEWEINFPPDEVNVEATYATVDREGHLIIDVQKLRRHWSSHP